MKQSPRHHFYRTAPAYVMTNEDLRWVNTIVNPHAQRVLTVAASGDHPLFYQLFGATHVDTFDISYCAKLITDIKCAAIRSLDLSQYSQLIFNLFNAPCVTELPHMTDTIMPQLGSLAQKFIKKYDRSYIFSNGIQPALYYKNFLPTPNEYQKLQQMNINSFHFINTDIQLLHTQCPNKYDIINLSNIFEYIHDTNIIKDTLCHLGHLLHMGGKIIVHQTEILTNTQQNNYYHISQQLAPWARMGIYVKDKTKDICQPTAIILQKINEIIR